MPALNISRAPIGELAAAELVEAVAAGDDRLEHHYLELKSDLDPTSKVGLAKLAKYILGSANRLPGIAARAFEGYGVMVIGVAPGEISGIPPVEILEISKGVRPYLGASGPRWDLFRVPVKGSQNEVLVIVIDPPRDGQGPYLCRDDGSGVLNGHIYVRADGETRDAKADEVDRLIERGSRAARTEVGFEVAVIGYVYPVEIDEQRTIEAHIKNTVEGLFRALPQAEPKRKPARADDSERQKQTDRTTVINASQLSASFNSSSANALLEAFKPSLAASAAMLELAKPRQAAIAAMTGELAAFQKSSALNLLIATDPEDRTEAHYRREIELWEGEFRKGWPGAVSTLAAHATDAVAIRVKNKAKTFFRDLELKIHLEGDVDGLDWLDGNDGISIDRLGLPETPRAWGPVQRSILDRNIVLPSRYISNTNTSSTYFSPLDWKNGGSVDITLKVGELRPHGEYLFEDEELVLVLPLTREFDVKGTWQITASGHDEIYAGDLQVEVGPPVDLTIFMRRLLQLDSD